MRPSQVISTATILAVFLAVPTFGKPLVSWSSRTVTASLFRGALKMVTLSFVSNEDMQNVDVFIVPALQPFLVSSPSHFDHVISGRSYRVSLLFSVPLATPLGTYNGVLQLRSSTGPARTYA